MGGNIEQSVVGGGVGLAQPLACANTPTAGGIGTILSWNTSHKQGMPVAIWAQAIMARA